MSYTNSDEMIKIPPTKIGLKLDQPVTIFSMIVTEMKNYCNYFLLMYIVVLVGGYMFSMITSL